MEKIIWAIQTNLGSQKDIERLLSVCEKECHVFPFQAIPFDTQLPSLPNSKEGNVVVYGSGTVVELVSQAGIYKPGVFSNKADLSWSKVQENYLHNMWSSGTKMALTQFLNRVDEFDESIFVRPDEDSKTFSGGTWKKQEFIEWIQNLQKNDTIISPENEQIIVAPVRELYQEYRLFIVDNKIVTGSLYRENGEVKKRAHIPNYVLAFAENLIKSWVPNEAFVMDIGLDKELNMGVIELNNINSSGFYLADIEKYVTAINAHIEQKNVLENLKQKRSNRGY